VVAHDVTYVGVYIYGGDAAVLFEQTARCVGLGRDFGQI